MERAARLASGHLPAPESVAVTALKERKRFAGLRKRLAEIDLWVREHPEADTRMVAEVLALARDLHQQVERIDKAGTVAIWISGAYFLQEMLSTSDPAVANLVGRLLVNPLTTKIAKEAFKNLYLSARGIRPGASAAIAAVRDYMGITSIEAGKAPKVFGSGVYRFWV
jgi:hypothetical protein